MSDKTLVSSVKVVLKSVAAVQGKERVDVESGNFLNIVKKFEMMARRTEEMKLSASRRRRNSNSNNNRDLIQRVLDGGAVAKMGINRNGRKLKTSPTQNPYKARVCYVTARKKLVPVNFSFHPKYNTLALYLQTNCHYLKLILCVGLFELCVNLELSDIECFKDYIYRKFLDFQYF